MFPYISVFGKNIGTYGLCMAVGVILAVCLAMLKAKKKDVLPWDILIVGAAAIGAAVICGGLMYTFVTFPLDEIIRQVLAGNFAAISGGIVFYGGLIGGILGGFLGIRLAGCNTGRLMSCVVPYIPLGHAIGRVGCLMAGCCHGFEYDGFLAVYYPNSLAGLPADQGYFPIQPLESLINLAIFGLLLGYEKRAKRDYDMLFAYLGFYAVGRFCLEMFRGDSIRGIYFGVSVSQWISIGMLVACVVYFLLGLRKAKTQQTQ